MPRVTGRKGKAGGAPAAIDANMMLTNEESRRKLQVLESTLLARKQWSDLLGQTHGGDRDLYESCGWKKNPNHQDYKRRFERQDVAHTLVTAYPDATWREAPTIRENDTKKDTPFEKAFKEHAEKVNLWHYLRRVDTMAGIGEYAVLLLGFKDPAELSKEITKAQEVMYLQPFFQGDAEISEWNNDPTSSPA